MTLKRVLIASAFLNIMLLSLTIILASSCYINRSEETQGNKLVSDGTQVTIPTEVINKSIPTDVSNQSEKPTAIEKKY